MANLAYSSDIDAVSGMTGKIGATIVKTARGLDARDKMTGVMMGGVLSLSPNITHGTDIPGIVAAANERPAARVAPAPVAAIKSAPARHAPHQRGPKPGGPVVH